MRASTNRVRVLSAIRKQYLSPVVKHESDAQISAFKSQSTGMKYFRSLQRFKSLFLDDIEAGESGSRSLKNRADTHSYALEWSAGWWRFDIVMLN